MMQSVPESACASQQSRADLHVHSKYSDVASTWYLNIGGFPESVMEPRDIYRICRERGMDFVTISDHDKIDGALEIADLPGTFISSEITATFPEDGCKIHCLVTGITQRQFREIDRRRNNIHDFHQYLIDENIIYSVAHPLFQVNDCLTVEHVEKLLLMFQRFEGINGTRDRRAADVFRAVAESLTPQTIAQMSDRQGIEPSGHEPWKKVFTGGSDDHGGEFLASAFTVTPLATNVEQFLQHLRAGRHHSGGSHGSSLRLAHSLIAISRDYLKQSQADGSWPDAGALVRLLNAFLQSPEPVALVGTGNMSGLAATVAQVIARHTREFDRPICEVHDLVGPADESDTFLATSRLCRELLTRWLTDAAQCAGQRRLFDLAGALPLAATTMLAHLPYLAAFATQHKDDGLLRDIAKHFKLPSRQRHVPQRRLWATDTLLDVNGVAKTIQAVCKVARDRGCTLRVMTSLSDTSDAVEAVEIDVKNFEPLIEFPLPLYWQQRVGVPPLLDVVEYIERESISEIIVSTPGPVGLVAGLAGRLLGIPVRGIYHTDFPAYVRHLTGNEHLEEITTGLMRRLYGACEEVLAPSDAYRQRLEAMGLAKTKLRVLPRGVDTGLFHPNRRDEAYWARHGIDQPLVFLYVGRVSEEKNIELLLSEFSDLIKGGFRAGLAIVGDGPARVRLEQRYPHREIRFTGFLDGHCLATAYASADVFVFPSTSDTFGNVVLEAQSSGLPAIVSDRGGPAEILGRNDSGFIVPVDRHGALRSAMQTYIEQPWLRGEHGQRARQNALQSSWAMVFEMLWGSAPPAESLGEKFQAPQISTHAAEVT